MDYQCIDNFFDLVKPFRIRDLIVKFHHNVFNNSSDNQVQINKSKYLIVKLWDNFIFILWN